jgi:hypothetical protein
VQLDDVGVGQLGAQRHLADGRLGDARVGHHLALLIRLELLDGELAGLALPADGLVDAAIGSTADEADDLVPVNDTDL